MQATSARFDELQALDVRPIGQRVRVSFDKTFDEDVEFFTLDESQLDGVDVLAPVGDNVLAEWDKYSYTDYSDRVMYVEWTKEEDFPYSVYTGLADVAFTNHDDFFTPGSGSSIDGTVLPRRPFRILSGFKNENIPQFVGLSDSMPKIDEKAKTATFHCEGFLSYLFNRKLDETAMFIDKTTDEVLTEIFTDSGLLPAQFDFDIGVNEIGFAYFEKDTTVGNAVKQLMEAEMGSLYMDEFGIIQFKNRTSVSNASVASFDKSNTIDLEVLGQDRIINTVSIISDVREVQDLQPIYQQEEVREIPANGQIEVWADFFDPVTSANTPVLGFTDSDSYFEVYDAETGGSEVGSVSATAEVFAMSTKITLTSTNAFPVYLRTMEIWGTPAKVVDKLRETYVNPTSVGKYEEQLLTINNNLVQSRSGADSLGFTILNQFAEYQSNIRMNVKAQPALQLGDTIAVDYDNIVGDYVISKIENTINQGSLRQIIEARLPVLTEFFTLNESQLDGSDVLSP